jgi:hypothetical protein
MQDRLLTPGDPVEHRVEHRAGDDRLAASGAILFIYRPYVPAAASQ